MTRQTVEVILPFTHEECRCIQPYMEMTGIDHIGEFVIAALNFDLECQRLPLIDIKQCSFDFDQIIRINDDQERMLLTRLKIIMVDDAHDVIRHMFDTHGDTWIGTALEFYVTSLECRPAITIQSPHLRRHFH